MKLPSRAISVFYMLCAFVLANQMEQVFNNTFTLNFVHWAWPVMFLKNFVLTPKAFIIFYSLFFCQVLAAILFGKYLIVRILAAVSIFICFGMQYSFNKIGHNGINWIVASLLLIFIDFDYNKTLKILRYYLFSCYFNSGLWKLKVLFGFITSHDYSKISLCLPTSIAYAVAEGNTGDFLGATTELLKYPIFSGLLWVGVILIELMAILVLFDSKKINAVLAYLFLMFHLSTSFFMGIFFSYQYLLLICIMFILPQELYRPELSHEPDAEL